LQSGLAWIPALHALDALTRHHQVGSFGEIPADLVVSVVDSYTSWNTFRLQRPTGSLGLLLLLHQLPLLLVAHTHARSGFHLLHDPFLILGGGWRLWVGRSLGGSGLE